MFSESTKERSRFRILYPRRGLGLENCIQGEV